MLARALAAAGTVATLLLTTPATPAYADRAATTAAPAPPPADTAPLALTIRTMSPSALPATGNIRLTGTVTNRSEETWSNISVLAFAGDELAGVPVEPMRNVSELAAAMETPFDEVVGERITDAGTPGNVEELAPGESSGYTVVVPAEAIEVGRAGVYWFGVHALGESPSTPLDSVADGRARTFLPYVPRRFHEQPLTAALVVPLTQPVRWAADGSVDDVESWTRALRPEGRLTQLLDFVSASSDPVTWVVDPALVDAVAHLAAGNPPRSLAPTPVEGDPTASPTGEPTAGPDDPGGAASDGAEGGETDPAEAEQPTESALVAQAWLGRLAEVLPDGEVLTLPYGNVDVPALLAHGPELLELSLAQRSPVLEQIVATERVLSSPSGYLDAASIASADDDTRVLVTDRMVGARAPAVADVDGRRVLLTSHGATQGSPGPGASLTAIGIRQRLAAEAAVRVIKNDRQPLVSTLPLEWSLDEGPTFFDGLDLPWLELGTLDAAEVDAGAAASLTADDLDYTRLQLRRQLDAPTVDGVAELIRDGDTLQNLLVDNTQVGGTITEEALSGLSYFMRNDQVQGRGATASSHSWVLGRLGQVRITASPGVTLASNSGDFVVTLTNGLEQRVGVSIRAESDAGIEVVAPEQVVLAPGARQSVLLEARTTTNTVHDVRLLVTDAEGAPLGSTDSLPIRSTEVSGVIWLIMGTGAGLLFLAIAVRLVRRVQAARRGEPGAGLRGNQPDPEPTGPTEPAGPVDVQPLEAR
jgi:hypothetical protein